MDKLIHGGDIYTKREIAFDNIVDFSANINPMGMPASVKSAIINYIEDYQNYPDPLCRELRKAISKEKNVAAEYILCGNGAADLIYKIALGLKPKQALLLSPTFSEYELALNTVNCNVKYYNLCENKDFKLSDDFINNITSNLDVIFLCNPNNPTGMIIEKKFMIKIAEKCDANNVVLVVDECFSDFLTNEMQFSISDSFEKYSNVIILKAFTKMYAMAGIRLGYLLCSNENIIDKVASSGQAWSVSTVASKCGIEAIKENGYVEKTKLETTLNRVYLQNELVELGFKIYPSFANFILFKTENSELFEKLLSYGILIRSCENYKSLNKNYFRIAVKSKKDNEYLIECIKKIQMGLSL